MSNTRRARAWGDQACARTGAALRRARPARAGRPQGTHAAGGSAGPGRPAGAAARGTHPGGGTRGCPRTPSPRRCGASGRSRPSAARSCRAPAPRARPCRPRSRTAHRWARHLGTWRRGSALVRRARFVSKADRAEPGPNFNGRVRRGGGSCGHLGDREGGPQGQQKRLGPSERGSLCA